MEVDLLPGQETRDAVQLHGDRLQVLTAEEIFLRYKYKRQWGLLSYDAR